MGLGVISKLIKPLKLTGIMKLIKIINIALIILAIVLIVNLIQPISTITGNLIYNLDIPQPLCYFYNSGELNAIPIDICCYEIQKKLICKSIDTEEFDLKCYTSEASGRYYLINHKTFNYCKREGYDVKVK